MELVENYKELAEGGLAASKVTLLEVKLEPVCPWFGMS